jgi:hypothetical protein
MLKNPLNLEVEYTKIEEIFFYCDVLLKRVEEGKSIKFKRQATFFSHAPEIPICLAQNVKGTGRMLQVVPITHRKQPKKHS